MLVARSLFVGSPTGLAPRLGPGDTPRASVQAIHCGTFVSVKHLIDRIRTYVQRWNAHAEPFVWTATAHEIPLNRPGFVSG